MDSELDQNFVEVIQWHMTTITMVITTMLVNVLKIFDIIYVMTNGNFGTEVIANRMFKEMFQFSNTGRASAIAVVLFFMIIPIMYANVRQKLREG